MKRQRHENNDDPNDEKYRKLFIGGLSYETSEEGLKEHFGKYGEITDVVVIRDKDSKKSKGFGFVTYESPSMLDAAQDERPHNIDGRTVETKRAMPREESRNPTAQATVQKLFIGGLKEGTTEEDVRAVFEEYGSIEEVDMIKDKATGKMKGFGFIKFTDYDSVDKLVLKGSIELNGKTVDIKKAKQPNSEGGGRGGGRGGRGGGRGGRGGGGQGGGNWNQGFGQGYGGSSGGGPMRGYGNQSRGSGAPYGGGYGRGGGGY